jgi:hypothetical protein
MSPLVQTKRQIYLPGGGGGGSHGGSQELSIIDRLGTSRITIQEINGSIIDDSSVSFSTPESLGFQIDNGTLIYTDFETKTSMQELYQLLARAQEINAALSDSVYSLVIQAPDTIGSHSEIHKYYVLITDMQGIFVEAATLTITQQESQAGLIDQFFAVINLSSIETNAVFTETLSALIRTAETNGVFTEFSRFTISVIGNGHVATSGWTNPNNVIDNSLTTTATITATASGIGNATSATVNSSSEVNFPDFTLPGGFSVESAFMDVYSKGQRTVASTVTAGTASFTYQRSINDGGAYTNSAVASRSGSNTAVATFWDDSITPYTEDLSAVVTGQASINGFRFKTAAQAVSGGTSIGGAPQTVVSFYGVVLRLVITG